MRLAVLSDVHGNLPAVEAVLSELRAYEDLAGIVVAGDLLGGPHGQEAIHRLREIGALLIRGNSDNYTLAYDAGKGPAFWHTSRQWALMRWGHRHLDRETIDFLAALPEQQVVTLPGTAPILVVHGSPRDVADGLCPDRDPATLELFRRASLLPADDVPEPLGPVLAANEEPVLVCGHTHIPWVQEQDGRLVLNPGAVCGPLNGDVRAQYALLAWEEGHWRAEHHGAPYDLGQIRSAFQESGLLAEAGALARAFLLSIETGQNVGVFFLSYAYALAEKAGLQGCEFVPDAIWDEAAATWSWEEFEQGRPGLIALARSPRRAIIGQHEGNPPLAHAGRKGAWIARRPGPRLL